jgi:hypothetical protein
VVITGLYQQTGSAITCPGRQRDRLCLCFLRKRAELKNGSRSIFASTRQDITEVSLFQGLSRSLDLPTTQTLLNRVRKCLHPGPQLTVWCTHVGLLEQHAAGARKPHRRECFVVHVVKSRSVRSLQWNGTLQELVMEFFEREVLLTYGMDGTEAAYQLLRAEIFHHCLKLQ